MITQISDLAEFTGFIEQEPAVLAYFSTVECNVCKVLKPRVHEIVEQEYPKVKMVYVEINQSPELAARYTVFAVPTMVVFFEGREYIRKSRNFGLDEFRNELRRPYELMFSE
jgi:thioredoxin-like negative regulator of GroEL